MDVDESIIEAIEANAHWLKKIKLKGPLNKIVKDLVEEVPVPTPPTPAIAKQLTGKKAILAQRKLDIWQRTLDGQTPREIADALDLNVNNVRRILRDLRKSGEFPSKPSLVETIKSRFTFWKDSVVRKGSHKLEGELRTRYDSWLDVSKYGRATDRMAAGRQGQFAALRSYTAGGYSVMNRGLRQFSKATGLHKPHWTRSSKALQELLLDAPAPPKDLVVWRGTDIIGRVVDRKGGKFGKEAVRREGIRDGDIIELDGFQSTAVRPEKAWVEAGDDYKTMLEIHPTCGAYVDAISRHKGEKEFLIPHGAQYRVAGVKKLKVLDKHGRTEVFDVIQLEQIGGCPKTKIP